MQHGNSGLTIESSIEESPGVLELDTSTKIIAAISVIPCFFKTLIESRLSHFLSTHFCGKKKKEPEDSELAEFNAWKAEINALRQELEQTRSAAAATLETVARVQADGEENSKALKNLYEWLLPRGEGPSNGTRSVGR